MQITGKRFDNTDEKYTRVTFDNGFTCYIIPKDVVSAYAAIGVHFGSCDTVCADTNEVFPVGTAHFLEHKMFQTRKGDAFELFADLGAAANAYTANDKTVYNFSCTENFCENYAVLLDMVFNAHYTKKSVEKEKGIISDGDTVDVYISSDNSNDYRSIKSDLEKGITDVNVEVHGIDSLKKPAKPTEGVKKPDPPKPDAEKKPEINNTDKNNTPKKPDQAAVTPPAPAEPPAPAVQPPKDNGKAEPAVPPAPPVNNNDPEPPKAPDKQGEAQKPEAPAEPDKPALPNEDEPPQPEHEIHEKLSADTDISERISFSDMNPVMLLPEHKQEEEPLMAAEPPKAEPPAADLPSPEAGIPPQPPVLP